MHYRFDRFVLDIQTGTLTSEGQAIALRRRAFDLLRVLIEHAPGLVSRDRILDEVWGHDALTPNVLPQTISEIRHALGDSAQLPRLIETQHRRGYRILVPVTRYDGQQAAPTSEIEEARTSVERAAAPLPASSGRLRWPGLAAVALVAIALVVAWKPWSPTPDLSPDVSKSRPAIALMIQGDPQAPPWLAGAGSELLAAELGTDGQIRLLRGHGRSDMPGVSDGRWQSWLREVLGADYALTGLWRLDGGRPVLRWSVLRLSDSQVTHSAQSSDSDLGALSRDVAVSVRRHLELVSAEADDLPGLPRSGDARAAYYRGLAALADGRPGLAVAELEVAVADETAGARVHLALARAWRSAGYAGRARALFEAVLESRHSLTVAERFRLEAELARTDNRPADAAASLLALHRLHPDDSDVAYDLIDAQIQARQASSAETILHGLDTLSGEGSSDPRWHIARAQLAIMQFQLDVAATATLRAQALANEYGLDELAAQAQLVGVAVDRRRNDPKAAAERLRQLLGGTLTPAQRVRTLLQQGNLLRDSGDFDGAEQVIGEAIVLATELGSEAQLMLAKVELHTVKSLRSHSEQTLVDLEALEPRITLLDDAGLLARYFNTLGVQATLNKEIDKADAYLRRAAAEARKAGQIDNEAGVYNNLGNVLSRNGRTEDAIRAWEQALRVFNEVDNGLGAAITLSNLGGAAVSRGNLAQAREQFQQALDRFVELDSVQHMARTRFDLGQVAERQGRLAEAAELYRQALDAQREAAADRALHAAAALARVQLAMARIDEARSVLDSVSSQLAASTDPGAQARVHASTGHLALLSGDPEGARSAFTQARSLRGDARGDADKVAYSDLDLLTLDLHQARPPGQIRARAETLYRHFVRDNDLHGQFNALLIQSQALLVAGRSPQAATLLEKAEALLSAWPDAGLAYELGRQRILSDAPLEGPGQLRLRELAAGAEAEGFVVLALRSRLDADPDDVATRERIITAGLRGLGPR